MNKRLFPLVWILFGAAQVNMAQGTLQTVQATFPAAQTPIVLSLTSHQVAVDAYMVTRMAEKFHTQPRVLDTGFSVLFFDQFINELDDQHFLFLKSDMEKLDVYRYQLDGEIRLEQTGFLDLAKAIYQQRIRQADSLIDRLSEVPVDTAVIQKTVDTLAPVDLEGMRSHLALLYGQAVVENMQEDLDSGRKNTETFQRKRVRNTFKGVLTV